MQGEFKGQILHSFQHGKATDHIGKKVVVIGSCSSGKSTELIHACTGINTIFFKARIFARITAIMVSVSEAS